MNALETDLGKRLWKDFHGDPTWFVVLGEKMKLLQAGSWPQSLIDCVYQYDWHHKQDIFDLWVFLDFYARLTQPPPDFAVFQIPVGEEPHQDKDVAGNNVVLNNLSRPFKGRFWGGNQDEDGFIEWDRPIHVTSCAAGEDREEVRWLLAKPKRVPLEVGYNSSSKFRRDIRGYHSYARWPCGQPFITVFLDIDRCELMFEDDAEFDVLLHHSGESVEDYMISQRSPWERWDSEVN